MEYLTKGVVKPLDLTLLLDTSIPGVGRQLLITSQFCINYACVLVVKTFLILRTRAAEALGGAYGHVSRLLVFFVTRTAIQRCEYASERSLIARDRHDATHALDSS